MTKTLDAIAEDLKEETEEEAVETPYENVELDRETRREMSRARIVAELEKPLSPSLVKQREGFGTDRRGNKKMLDYLEWHQVAKTLNKIFGFGGWDTSTETVEFLHEQAGGVPKAVRVTKTLSVNFYGIDGYDTTTYSMTGYAAVVGSSWKSVEMALGNAEAKAFKRAAACLGDQFGLSLYEGDEDEEDTTEKTSSASFRSSTTSSSDTAECEDCGKAIRGYTNKQGKSYTTEDLVNMSKKQTGGHVLCLDCRQKRNN